MYCKAAKVVLCSKWHTVVSCCYTVTQVAGATADTALTWVFVMLLVIYLVHQPVSARRGIKLIRWDLSALCTYVTMLSSDCPACLQVFDNVYPSLHTRWLQVSAACV